MLNADLKCMKMLLKWNKDRIRQNNTDIWKYTSSMAGVELPIVTYSKFHKKVVNLGERSSVESFGFNQIPKNSSYQKSGFNSTNKQLLLRLTHAQKRDCLNLRENGKPGSWNLQEPLMFKLQNPLRKGHTYNFQIFKGLKNVILYHKDAEFMIHHPVAKQFHRWQNHASMPEETFFATLIRLRIDPINKTITQVINLIIHC